MGIPPHGILTEHVRQRQAQEHPTRTLKTDGRPHHGDSFGWTTARRDWARENDHQGAKRKLTGVFESLFSSCLTHDSVYPDEVVGVPSKQSTTVRRPGQRRALGGLAFLSINFREVGLDLINDAFALKVKDLDARGGSRTEPVPVRGEDEGVDDVSGFQGVKVLALVQVP